jgi:hypothetical protein
MRNHFFLGYPAGYCCNKQISESPAVVAVGAILLQTAASQVPFTQLLLGSFPATDCPPWTAVTIAAAAAAPAAAAFRSLLLLPLKRPSLPPGWSSAPSRTAQVS